MDDKYRKMAREDEDFAGMREEACFQALVGEGAREAGSGDLA
jgi:hypothetical protein